MIRLAFFSMTLAVIIPAYNEAANIRPLFQSLERVLAGEKMDWHVLFVDDGSTDGTLEAIEALGRESSRVRFLSLSRNFGQEGALAAGMDHAQADAVITMDADMQHPPRLIPKLITQYEAGSDVVYTSREEADELGVFRKISGTFFYRLVNLISDVPIQRNASDFRLISRRVAQLLQTRVRERTMFLRGIVSWVGFRQSKVAFKADNRFAGSSKYTFSRNLQFALAGIISFSRKPLRAATLIGALVALFGFVFAVYTVIEYFYGVALAPGWASLIVLVSIFGGLQLFFLGVIGEYIGGIFEEVKGRPHYIVEDSVNVQVSR